MYSKNVWNKYESYDDIMNFAEDYKDYPINPASDPKNILMTSSNGAILNPAIGMVRAYTKQ
mgnify:CR=1 FL=1